MCDRPFSETGSKSYESPGCVAAIGVQDFFERNPGAAPARFWLVENVNFRIPLEGGIIGLRFAQGPQAA